MVRASDAPHDDEWYRNLARRLRRGVEIRNHHSFKTLYYSCAPGSALVSWLVAGGVRPNRDAAASLVLDLIKRRELAPAGANLERTDHSFRDADGSFYRFAVDEPKNDGLLEACTFRRADISPS